MSLIAQTRAVFAGLVRRLRGTEAKMEISSLRADGLAAKVVDGWAVTVLCR
ncbi:hypothetical protein [Dactylosporangium fulvum]|uniref:Uncharacterized protein n=1 Tax=Dactylosporangium fulvum TaxID=53359 RepID=A0ABY5VXA6_9ACTN|nr:hypothetical protein [Dactylosporangium fulvum]UWP81897.1 hypothetical protein Dfulv_43580 [Dactylosporangium fulvum]